MTGAAELRSGKGRHDENFPVASWLIHPRHRAPILAFYEFVRAADDIADHPALPAGEKLSSAINFSLIHPAFTRTALDHFAIVFCIRLNLSGVKPPRSRRLVIMTGTRAIRPASATKVFPMFPVVWRICTLRLRKNLISRTSCRIAFGSWKLISGTSKISSPACLILVSSEPSLDLQQSITS